MKIAEFTALLDRAYRRHHVIGDERFGVVAGLDLEGRLFTVLDGEVVSRVNAEAIMAVSTRHKYQNPGGDVLWPAPEGTMFGYEYTAGTWRVPPEITGARYVVVQSAQSSAVIEAEIDLVNNKGIGIPCLFTRDIHLDAGGNARVMHVKESITYLGTRTLQRGEFLIAPWSLSQFDSGPGAEVVFPHAAGSVRDLYDASDSQRSVRDGLCHTKTDTSQRYQIAISAAVDHIEYHNPEKKLTVRRTAEKIRSGRYIDIADAPPDTIPSDIGVRFSVYSDKSGFMEIEAAGGCIDELKNGDTLRLRVSTAFSTGDM
ncbi:MAG: DUF6786 family protein [Spirochaetota bacterium]